MIAKTFIPQNGVKPFVIMKNRTYARTQARRDSVFYLPQASGLHFVDEAAH